MRTMFSRRSKDSEGLRPPLACLVCGFAALLGPAFAAEPPVESPVAPEESLQHFVLSPELDLRIDLVAAEPQVIDPVAVAFDERGRMFVVEMRDYPSGPAEGEKPASRISLLEDADGDGRFETAHVFADGLLFPTGVLPWDGGAIVTLAGEVRFLKDTDGDHKADVNEVWFTGFSQDNTQLRANHPTVGPDGLIYIANGLRGGKVKAVKEGWPQQEIDLRDHDFRFDPRTGRAEAVAGGGQFGLTFDAFGNRFICSNRNPGDHVVLELRELERNKHLAIGKPTQVVAAAGDDSHVYPLVDAWTTSTLHGGQFTAACGVKIFTGDALPAACVGNVFTCEPTGSLVHREILEPAGGTFRATPGEKQVEFLASRDPWFRPVNLTVGPDGALYVVDMYRAVIEHPQWMPTELKTRRDLRWGDDRGRIYRVAAKDKPPGKMPTLAAIRAATVRKRLPATPGDKTLPDSRGSDDGRGSDEPAVEALFAALDSPNGWTRDTAARLLSHNSSGLDKTMLAEVAANGKTPAGRVRAAQLATSLLDNTIEDVVQPLLDDADPRVVATGVSLLGRCGKIHVDRDGFPAGPCLQADTVRAKLHELASAGDARVRFEVALVLGELSPNEAVTKSLAAIAARDSTDRWTRSAVLSSTRDPQALYDAVAKVDADGAVPFLVDLAELIGRRRDEQELGEFLARLASTGPEGGW
ncbi:MAG: PVC-type heme-binding CxxCH protein, partial [Planctomycetaceae bacterium]